jgi:hypothetical protein
MNLFAAIKRLVASSAGRGETPAPVNGDFDDAELFEFVRGYAVDAPQEIALADLRKAVFHPAVHALIERHEVVSAFARGALGCGDDDAKLDAMLRQGPAMAYLSGDLGRNTAAAAGHDLIKAENELATLRKQIEAQRLLLEQAERALAEDGTTYVELQAFLQGKMPPEDVIALLGQKSTVTH